MNLICELFGHKYDKAETTARILESGLCEIKTICPRCNKITYVMVVPEKTNGRDKQANTKGNKASK